MTHRRSNFPTARCNAEDASHADEDPPHAGPGVYVIIKVSCDARYRIPAAGLGTSPVRRAADYTRGGISAAKVKGLSARRCNAAATIRIAFRRGRRASPTDCRAAPPPRV